MAHYRLLSREKLTGPGVACPGLWCFGVLVMLTWCHVWYSRAVQGLFACHGDRCVHVVAALLVQGSVVILNQFVDPVMADDVCSTNFGFSLWMGGRAGPRPSDKTKGLVPERLVWSLPGVNSSHPNRGIGADDAARSCCAQWGCVMMCRYLVGSPLFSSNPVLQRLLNLGVQNIRGCSLRVYVIPGVTSCGFVCLVDVDGWLRDLYNL